MKNSANHFIKFNNQLCKVLRKQPLRKKGALVDNKHLCKILKGQPMIKNDSIII